MLIDEHATALLRPVHVRFSLPVDVKQSLEAVTAIGDSKFATLVQNKTSALHLCHIIKGVEGANNGNEGSCHSIIDVFEDMIPERLVQRIFVFPLNIA